MNTVVIARYAETLDWVEQIPRQFDVYIYNKGDAINASSIISRAKIIDRPNVGRESETYLWHMQSALAAEGHTVFCQGDPFEHSPDFIDILRNASSWSDIQPLSWQWRGLRNIPPAPLLARYRKSDIGRVRPEWFSLITWNPLHFYDEGAYKISRIYREAHGLSEGENIAAHFLVLCGLRDLAGECSRHLVGKFSYGAVFAVRNDLVRELPKENLALLYQATLSHQIYGYILERLWLHLFGASFYLRDDPAQMQFTSSTLLPREEKVPREETKGRFEALSGKLAAFLRARSA